MFKVMKSVSIYLLALFALSKCEEEASYPRQRRGSFQATYPLENNLHIGGVDVNTYGKETILPIQQFQQADINLKVDLTGAGQRGSQLQRLSSLNYIVSNSIDKPVQEAQDYVPPQSIATAIIPPRPPPAVPVNAVAANVPAQRGAVFLGSGSLGVIDLGGGAYALGSGSLGYSGVRSNPRSSFKEPLLPPVQAAPNLLPAAVPSPQPPQPAQPPIFGFDHQFFGGKLPVDQNGYEYLPPNRVGFGDPLPPRPLKTTMSFATPSANLILPPQPPQQSFQPIDSPIYGQRINAVYSDIYR